VSGTDVDWDTLVGFDVGSYTAAETGLTGYTASVWSGDCAADGSVTLAEGDEKVCYITNSDIAPKLTLVKTVTNDDGGTHLAKEWTLYATGSPRGFSGTGNQHLTLNKATLGPKDVFANVEYTLSESGPDGYTEGTWSCLIDGEELVTGNKITLDEGESAVCKITNDDIPPELTVIKHVIDFTGAAVAADFTMYVNGTNVSDPDFPGKEAPGTTVTLNAGAYSVSEDMGQWAGQFSTTYSADCEGTIDIGEKKTCTVTNYRMTAVTDSMLCYFDRDPSTEEREFRLLFTPDVQNYPAFKLTASNPGQFYYNVFYVGDGTEAEIEMTIPYPFVTQGAMALHAYGSVDVYTNDLGQICFDPGDDHGALRAEIVLEDYVNGTVTVKYNFGVVPDGQLVYVNLHLDYGLKGGQDRYEPALNADETVDAAEYNNPANILIYDRTEYAFSAAVNGGAYGELGADTIVNVNEFKKTPGIAGFVYLPGATEPAGGGILVILHIPPQYKKFAPDGDLSLEALTDEDGWYMINFKHRGKPSDDYLAMVFLDGVDHPPEDDPKFPAVGDDHDYWAWVSLKGNAFAEVHFNEPTQ
jgi:hypothetical protein